VKIKEEDMKVKERHERERWEEEEEHNGVDGGGGDSQGCISGD